MRLALAVMLAASLTAIPARAEVTASSAAGFVVSGEALLAVPPAKVWGELVRPQDWWSSDHSWSGSAANMSLDPVAGGCFCEAIPGDLPGSVEHMRVIHVRPESMLVMRGSLGPLQGEALTGVLTINLQPRGEGGTTLSWTYVVGGYSRFALPQLAPAVDGVIAEQMDRLAVHLSGGA